MRGGPAILSGYSMVFYQSCVERPRELLQPALRRLLTDIKSRAVTTHSGLCEFTSALKADGLAQTVRVPWFPDPPCIITVSEALVQVAMHSQHHRGQCMTRLKDFGGQPQNVDWIIWLWKQKPAAPWL